MQKGFIQIPVLIMILIGTAVVGGGGYYAVKEISKAEPVEVVQEENETLAANDVATSTTDSTKDKEVGETPEPQAQTVVESDNNSTDDTLEVDTNTVVATEIPKGPLPKKYPLDAKTEVICIEIENQNIPNTESLLRSIVELCDEVKNEVFETQADFTNMTERISEKWALWQKIEAAYNRSEDSEEETQEQQADNDNSTEDEESTTATAEELSEKYATIIKLTDSNGNVNPQSEHNEQNPTWLQPWPTLEVGGTVTFTVDVANQTANPVSYQFVGTGFPNEWQSSNSVTVDIDEDVFNVETIHLRVFVKNSDSQYRAPNYDDMIQVFYTKE